jgi:hypothetical protein
MQYQVVTSTDKNEFVTKVNELVNFGWQPIGSHQVVTNQITEVGSKTYYNNEYSQTMVKNVLHIKENVVDVLNTLKRDAEMALSGEWDCTTSEGIESFNDQIELIDKLLDKLR